eukprot:6360773-Prymnesium_polylepis.1
MSTPDLYLRSEMCIGSYNDVYDPKRVACNTRAGSRRSDRIARKLTRRVMSQEAASKRHRNARDARVLGIPTFSSGAKIASIRCS